MSEALYKIGGLRFWNEEEILKRNQLIETLSLSVKTKLLNLNSAWQFYRVEGPCLAPASEISSSYSDDDVFVTNHEAAGEFLRLRAETTPSSYAYAEHIMQREKRARPPLCVWQVGKSFRRETSDGATAAKLRFNEFYQMEFQCIYSIGTKADYQAALLDAMKDQFPNCNIVDSDRLPSYSTSTIDVELQHNGEWREVCSCSVRNDFKNGEFLVAELAIGLDRLTEIK